MSRLKASRAQFGPSGTTQRGSALLIVVLGLSVATLASLLLAGRSLLTEQRTALLQWHSTQATQTAEAGLAWGLAALNTGRVSATCQPTSDLRAQPLAHQMTQTDLSTYELRPTAMNGVTSLQRPGCQAQDLGWVCRCPSQPLPAGLAGLNPWVEDRPAFEVHLAAVPTRAPQSLRLHAVGCSRAKASCLTTGTALPPEAAASVSMVVGRVPHLRVMPTAAITAAGDIRVAAPVQSPWVVSSNAPSSSSVDLRAGGTLQIQAGSPPILRPDSTPATGAAQDPWLSRLSLATVERRFATWMGLSPTLFAQLSSVSTLTCAAQGCADALASATASRPKGTVWVRGLLRLERPVTLGSAQEPVLLVAEEGLMLDAPGSQIYGVVMMPALTTQTAITPISGLGSVTGALIALGSLGHPTGKALPSVRFDPAVVASVLAHQGEWVRVPGGWRDY